MGSQNIFFIGVDADGDFHEVHLRIRHAEVEEAHIDCDCKEKERTDER